MVGGRRWIERQLSAEKEELFQLKQSLIFIYYFQVGWRLEPWGRGAARTCRHK